MNCLLFFTTQRSHAYHGDCGGAGGHILPAVVGSGQRHQDATSGQLSGGGRLLQAEHAIVLIVA